MPDKVDTRVTPALDPAGVLGLDGYNDETAGFVSEVLSVFTDAYQTCQKVHDARDAARQNPNWTEAQQVHIVGQEANKQRDRLLRRMDSAMRGIEANIKNAEAQLSQPLEARALGTLNAEIRNHAKTLDGGERSALLREAIEADDDTTVASILAAPPYLSGMTQVDRDYFLHLYHARRNPGMVARLRVLRSASEKIDRDGRLVIRALQKAVGATGNDFMAIDKADKRARDALKIEPAA